MKMTYIFPKSIFEQISKFHFHSFMPFSLINIWIYVPMMVKGLNLSLGRERHLVQIRSWQWLVVY